MAKIKTTEKGLFIREGRNSWMTLLAVQKYAAKINAKCLPVIKELELDSLDIKRVIRYSCKGGRKRMLADFLADLPEKSSFQKIAERQFNAIMASHPEYEECANAWRFVNFLQIGEDGLVHESFAAIEEASRVYVNSSEGLEFMQKVYNMVEAMNETFSNIRSRQKTLVLSNLVCWDELKGCWAVNPACLSDNYIKQLLSAKYQTRPLDFNNELSAAAKQEEAAARAEAIKDFGFEGEEAEEVDKANIL